MMRNLRSLFFIVLMLGVTMAPAQTSAGPSPYLFVWAGDSDEKDA